MQLNIIKLTEGHDILPFDCGNNDLNDFLYNDAKLHYSNLLSVTYLIEKNGITAAFFSLLNDKISIQDLDSKSQWKKNFLKGLHQRKKFKSYPAVKIGRLGVHSQMKGTGLGRDFIKEWFLTDSRTGCMYITVDAYKESLGFYEKNKFEYLSQNDITGHTRSMYYDLTHLLP